MHRPNGFVPIDSYAVISDQRTAALVASDGGIDWMCAPRFDHEPLFSRLLDPERGGMFELKPTEAYELVERAYVEDTNVLTTTWETASGKLEVTDALIVAEGIQRFSQIVRRVKCTSGSVALTWRARPRFGWAREVPSVRRHDGGHVLTHGELSLLVQAFDLGEPKALDGEVRATTTLSRGESGLVTLLFVHDFPLLAANREQAERRLDETVAFWHGWLRPLRYDGPWAPAVRRSALALAACVHDETGALVAAPTTSLPEDIGGKRNYDYRYCWVRDTSFALDAAMRLGFTQMAQATLGWLMRAARHTHPRVNVFFDLDGEPFAPQSDVDVPGYRSSTPVRQGNDAGTQLQLGCFGDIMETTWLFVRAGNPLDSYSALHLGEIADHVCEVWRNADSGIWELDDKRNYTRSKLSVWEALERALRLRDVGEVTSGHPDRWRRTMDEIAAYVTANCIDEQGVFRRDGDGSGDLDCSELLLPRTYFVEADDPRFAATIAAIRSELSAGGALLYRYTGMREEENAFLPCSFWLVEALSRSGRLDEAATLMDELVDAGNDVGLLSEEMDPSDHSLVGNFPQCLTHLALLNAAAVFAETAADERSD